MESPRSNFSFDAGGRNFTLGAALYCESGDGNNSEIALAEVDVNVGSTVGRILDANLSLVVSYGFWDNGLYIWEGRDMSGG